MKNIRQKPFDMRSLKLSPEEGFVLSRVDGTTTVKDLVALTGLDEGRVVDIVGRLAAEGALEVDADVGPASSTRAPVSQGSAGHRPTSQTHMSSPLAGLSGLSSQSAPSSSRTRSAEAEQDVGASEEE